MNWIPGTDSNHDVEYQISMVSPEVNTTNTTLG